MENCISYLATNLIKGDERLACPEKRYTFDRAIDLPEYKGPRSNLWKVRRWSAPQVEGASLRSQTLMNGQITTITEDYSIRVLAFSIITNGALAIFIRHGALSFRDSLGLYRRTPSVLIPSGSHQGYRLTRSKYSFSSLSKMISKTS